MVARDTLEEIRTRNDLSEFIDELRRSLDSGAVGWENRDFSSYLEAMSAWVADMDGHYQNRGESCPDSPTWKTLAEMLVAATNYE